MLIAPRRPILRFLAAVFMVLCLSLPASAWAQEASNEPAEPEIGARTAIVVEYPSGRILYQKGMHDKVAPASTTKILTAILAIEHGNLDQMITAEPDDLVGESSMGLVAGEQQTLHNLLYGMLLPSGNDAAMTIARTIGSQESGGAQDGLEKFVAMMNARVSQLGLTDSHFVNPHGLDAKDHYSSAYDLASFTWYALHLPVFAEIVKQEFYEAPGHPLRNTNEMLSRYDGTDGVKTGWTDAGGLCLVTSATRDGHRLISVVLNAPHWYTDSGALLDYGFARLSAHPTDASAEVLSVASRGAANFVLASATSTPKIETSELKQGGGVASTSGAAALAQAQPPAERGAGLNAPAPQADSTAEHLARALPANSTPAYLSLGGFGWVLLVLALLAALPVSLFFVRRRTVGSALAVAYPEGASFGPEVRPAVRVQPVQAPPAPRTLGEAPLTRRREPNLLLSREDLANDHMYRALALSAEARQGSAMAEFLLAIRSGASLDVAGLDQSYGLTLTGFLALSRAQVACGLSSDAVETLRYAVDALPHERILHLALRQLNR